MNENIITRIPVYEISDYNLKGGVPLLITTDELFNDVKEDITIPHRVGFYQVLFIENGNGSYFIDGKEFEYQPKSIITISKGQVRNYKNSPCLNGLALIFTDEYFYKDSQDIEWINKLKLFDHTSSVSSTSFDEDEFNNLLTHIHFMRSEILSEDGTIRDEIIYHLIKIILLYSERKINKENSEETIDIKGIEYLTKFKGMLEENYRTCRTVKQYADMICITPKKLNQITNTYWGKSAKRIIEERVILEIKRLLTYTDNTTKEVGYSFGFNDPTNFNRFFKKFANTTPSGYRDNIKRTKYNCKSESINHL
jgi:AraC-like DNA-binding protein